MAGSEFHRFAREWGFEHRTSSPRYPQSNGFVEGAVGIIKKSLKKTSDSYIALQSYRATPLGNGYSPAELLMGRKLRTSLPSAPSTLEPKLVNTQELKRWERRRTQQKSNYDRRRGARQPEPLRRGDIVWITNQQKQSVVQSAAESPRSYFVDTDTETPRRNRFHLKPMPGADLTQESSVPDIGQDTYTTRSGRVVKPVNRLQS